jgi:hypothetical protein
MGAELLPYVPAAAGTTVALIALAAWSAVLTLVVLACIRKIAVLDLGRPLQALHRRGRDGHGR